MDETNYCIWCGNKLEKNDVYCHICGAKIERDSTNVMNIKKEPNTYEIELQKIKEEYELKEEEALNLVKKHFKPTEITYTKFAGEIDNCRTLFYKKFDITDNLIKNLYKSTLNIEPKIKANFNYLRKITNQINNLIKELKNPSKNKIKERKFNYKKADENSKEEMDDLFEDMDELINSVKYYD